MTQIRSPSVNNSNLIPFIAVLYQLHYLMITLGKVVLFLKPYSSLYFTVCGYSHYAEFLSTVLYTEWVSSENLFLPCSINYMCSIDKMAKMLASMIALKLFLLVEIDVCKAMHSWARFIAFGMLACKLFIYRYSAAKRIQIVQLAPCATPVNMRWTMENEEERLLSILKVSSFMLHVSCKNDKSPKVLPLLLYWLDFQSLWSLRRACTEEI